MAFFSTPMRNRKRLTLNLPLPFFHSTDQRDFKVNESTFKALLDFVFISGAEQGKNAEHR